LEFATIRNATYKQFYPGKPWTTGLGISAGLLSALILAGCASAPQQQDQQLQQQAAQTTQEVKQGAKEAAAEAKVATANAGRELKDIAAGVRQGLHTSGSDGASGPKPSAGRIDLNSASEEDLAGLPGIGDSKAKEIIAARPYGSSHDLVGKGILSESHYERIARKVTAR